MGCIDMRSSGLEEKSASDGAEGRTPEIYHVRASSAIQIAASEFDKFQRPERSEEVVTGLSSRKRRQDFSSQP